MFRLPSSTRWRVARIWLLIYAATAAAALYLGSILPFMLIGGPRLFGSWHTS